MIEATDYALLNRYQREFPLVARPYAQIGAEVGLQEAEVLERYRRLGERGLLGRIGAVFRPNTVGASLLAALAVPAGELERIAALVSEEPQVNHNYEREHAFNLWFVVAAEDAAALDRVLDRIEARTGLKALRLPLAEEFHIDLGFDLGNGAAPRGAGGRAPQAAPLSAAERRLVAALGEGVPLVTEPWQTLGRAAGMTAEAVTARLGAWIDQGIVRRLGTVVRHRALGYRANAMVVWDLPDAEVSAAGRRLAAQAEVTLCYRRERRLPDWPYNLFCMVHGRERAAVLEALERITAAAGLHGRAREVLFSRRCHAQRAARYGASCGG